MHFLPHEAFAKHSSLNILSLHYVCRLAVSFFSFISALLLYQLHQLLVPFSVNRNVYRVSPVLMAHVCVFLWRDRTYKQYSEPLIRTFFSSTTSGQKLQRITLMSSVMCEIYINFTDLYLNVSYIKNNCP